MAYIRKILGAMPFGGQLNEAQSHKMINDWIKLGYKEIDTAILYQGGNSEKIIGGLKICRDNNKVKVATKANPQKGYQSEKIVEQVNEALSRLQQSCVDILYLHVPDHNTPIEDTLKGINQLYTEGKFKEFGLSNYASWEVVDIFHICKANGYVLPTVYQGMYNALTRDVELELFPALRKLGIRFYVYNPLAGGLLTGRYDFNLQNEEQPKGRFFASGNAGWTNQWTKAYQDRYWQNPYKYGVQNVMEVVKKTYNEEVTLLEASLRWLFHHSQLQDNDGVILGFSKPEHFQTNLNACSGGPLHEDVVKAFDDSWDAIKSKCPKYYR
uniref:Aflatoxin B1 aldehyde reductase member 3 n=1 Tax=Hydra vulgaris TaxID=6087 RepID=T2MHU9_HYDVU